MKHLPLFVFLCLVVGLASSAYVQTAPSSTAGNLWAVGAASQLYAYDNDDGIVLTKSGDVGKEWPALLSGYLPNRATFFDPGRGVLTQDYGTIDAGASKVALPWYQVTSLSINDSGYSGKWYTSSGQCTGKRLAYQYGQRKLHSMESPELRVAFAPTVYNAKNPSLGWSAFHSYDASWLRPKTAGDLFSWNNMVWSANVGGKVPVIHADGSAGVLTRSDFRSDLEAPTIGSYCAWLNASGKKTWGAFWLSN